MKKLLSLTLSLVLLLTCFCPAAFAGDISSPLVFDEVVISEEEMDSMEYFIDQAYGSQPYTIDAVKVVHGFDGSVFYVVECLPSGHFFYCPDADTFLEYGLTSDSPYKGHDEYLYYVGMLEYYVFVDGAYYNPVTERVLTEEDLPDYIAYSASFYQHIMETAQQEALDNAYADQFTDIHPQHWARRSISRCVQHGIMKGTTATTFEPEAPLTRAMLITVLYRMAGEPQVTGSHSFEDVPEKCYYAKAVAWAYENGVTKGTSQTTFSPHNEITRNEVIRMIYRYDTEYAGCQVPQYHVEDEEYPDLADLSGEVYAAWYWALSGRIINGYSAYDGFHDIYLLKIDNHITRAETAKIVFAFHDRAELW